MHLLLFLFYSRLCFDNNIKQIEKSWVMATHSNILAWKIPWMEKPGRLQYMGSQRVRHDWVTSLHFFNLFITLKYMDSSYKYWFPNLNSNFKKLFDDDIYRQKSIIKKTNMCLVVFKSCELYLFSQLSLPVV